MSFPNPTVRGRGIKRREREGERGRRERKGGEREGGEREGGGGETGRTEERERKVVL